MQGLIIVLHLITMLASLNTDIIGPAISLICIPVESYMPTLFLYIELYIMILESYEYLLQHVLVIWFDTKLYEWVILVYYRSSLSEAFIINFFSYVKYGLS